MLTLWADYLSTSSLSTDFQYVLSADELHGTKYAEYDRTDADTDDMIYGPEYGGVGAIGGSTYGPNNRTNLAIKGIIAIGAMSNMSLAIGRVADAEKYHVCINRSDLQAVQ